MTRKTSRITIDVSISNHKKLKAAASLIGVSMKDLIVMSLELFMKKNKFKEFPKIKNRELSLSSLDELFKSEVV
ncbi:MAG: hypothetical protein V4487_05440 [Chlamydiota bacterium]